MSLKEKLASVNMSAIRRGALKPAHALRLFRSMDFILSKNLSSAGRFLRQSQLSFLSHALDPKNRTAWTSVLFPAEILYPLGIYPLSLEILSGMFSTVGLSAEFLSRASGMAVPNTMCSFHRLLIGLASSGYFNPPGCVAVTSLFCDGNLKSFSEAAAIADRPFLYLDIPYEYNDASVEYLREQLEDMTVKMAGIYGVKFSSDAVKASVFKANEGLKRLKRIYELRRDRLQSVFRGYEMINFCFPSHYLLGSDLLIKTAGRIIASLEKGDDKHKYFIHGDDKTRRLMWMHIVPQYDTPLWDLLDNGRTTRIVCEEYTTPYFDEYDPCDPFGSIARRLILHPSNGPIERRIAHALKIARDFRVDGVIHYSSWGCHQAAGNISLIERAFEREGFKFLNLNGDAVDRENTTFGQHKTRIEAFLERM